MNRITVILLYHILKFWYYFSMAESKERMTTGIQRYFMSSPRICSINIIPFDKMTRLEYIVQVSDISVVGVGIVSREPIDHGLVCFENSVGGQKFGVVAWSRPSDGVCRAGINFVTLSKEKEQYVTNQIRKSPVNKQLCDPDGILEGLLKSLKPETSG